MKYKKLLKVLREIFEEDETQVQIVLDSIENNYNIWRRNDKSKR